MTNKFNLKQGIKKYYPLGFLFILIFGFVLIQEAKAKTISVGTASDNIGIGTDSPGTTYRLNVNGNSNITGTLNVTGGITGASLGSTLLGASNVSAGAFGSNSGGGNYSFPGRLSVGGSAAYGMINSVSSPGAYTAAFLATDAPGFSGIVIKPNTDAQRIHTEWWGVSRDVPILIGTYSHQDDMLAIAPSGNVGIGKISPQVKLDVKGKFQADNSGTYTNYSWAGGTLQTNSVEILDRVGGSTSDGIYPTLTFHDYGNGGAQFSMEGSTATLHLGSGASNSAGTLAGSGGYFSKLKIWGALETTGTISAGSFSGPMSGSLNAANLSSGTFGANVGGGNYSFPGSVNALTYGQDNNGLKIFAPGGASSIGNPSSVTGAIKIKLPVYRTSTMMRMTVKVYQYNSNKSYTVDLGGYNYGPGGWYNTFANVTSGDGANLTVRFGNDGSSNIIWIGETTSTWSYPQVFVTDFEAGYSGIALSSWASNWQVSFTTAFDSVETVATSAFTWNSINDGSGSGLDSDFLDGYHYNALPYYPAGYNAAYQVSAGDGNGLKFWNGSDSYKVSMGVGSLYQYGPVTDYSIKTQMDAGSTGRGFTWGREGVTPIAGLNSTSGNMQIAGTMTAASFSGNGAGLTAKFNFGNIDVNTIGDNFVLEGGSTASWSNRGPSAHNGGAILHIPTHPGGYYSDLWFDTGNNRIYSRAANGGGYSGWDQLARMSDISTVANSDTVDSLHASAFLRAGTQSPSGNAELAQSTNSSSYSDATIELRELNYGGAQTGAIGEAPRLSFHWGGRVASQITMLTDGAIQIRNNPGTGYETLKAGTIYSNDSAVITSGNIGSQSVNYASSAGSASSATNATNANWINYNNAANGSDKVQFMQISSNNAAGDDPTGSWVSIMKMNHGDGDTYYNRTLAFDFFSNDIYTRKRSGGTATGWMKLVLSDTSNNVNLGTGQITSGGFIYNSDIKLKKNIATIESPLTKILQLRGVTFNWKKDNQPGVGLIAQEVEKVFPELVSEQNGIKSVQYGNLVAPLIEAVKEQQKEIQVQTDRANAQQKEIENMKAQIQMLQAKN